MMDMSEKDEIELLRGYVKFLLIFAPTEENFAEGLDPTFYITLTADGDRHLHERVAEIKKAVE